MNRCELPLLANRLMVPAILTSRKTVTRRLINNIVNGAPDKWSLSGYSKNVKGVQVATFEQSDPSFFHESHRNEKIEIPFQYSPGDLLWVREDHQISLDEETGCYSVKFREGKVIKIWSDLSEEIVSKLNQRKSLNTGRFVAGRYLPKALARTWLMVIDVRVERLQDITDAEALREGVEKLEGYYSPTWKHYDDDGSNYHVALTPRFSFQTLIQHLHGDEIWDKNPWVWVVDFMPLSFTGRPTTNGVRELVKDAAFSLRWQPVRSKEFNYARTRSILLRRLLRDFLRKEVGV